MTGVADSAVGAILEIPDSALRNIEKAERAIKQLALTSAEAAGKVNDHWGIVAPHGLQKFIDKIAEAKEKMDGLGTVNINLNVGGAKSQMDTAVNVVKTGADNISETLQRAAQTGWDSLNQNKRPAFLDALNLELSSIQEVEHAIKQLKKTMITLDEPTGKGLREVAFSYQTLIKQQQRSSGALTLNRQQYADVIGYLEKMVSLWKQTESEKNKALSNIQQKQQNQTDKAYLDEQKRLLTDILDLRKQVNGQKIVVAQGQVTGSSTLEQDKKILSDLIARLYEAKDKLKEYNAEKYKNVSAEGQAKAQVNTLNQENALIKEQMSFREKLNSAIARGNELVAQTQAGKARLGSSDESVAQRQLNSDYKEMLKIIKEYGEVRAKAASEGRNMTQQEYALVQTIIDRYRIFKDDINRVASSYSNMAQASAQSFQNDKTSQMSRNAVLLAEANEKAAQAALKRADAEAKAEEKAIASGEKIIAQKEAQIAKQEAAEKKAAQDYEKWWLSALSKRESEEARVNQKLVDEYKRLYAENEKLYASMRKYYNEAGGTPTTATSGTRQIDVAYREIEARHMEVLRQMRELESKNIQEIADFRQQKDLEANQRSISEFIQAEAQKKAEAQKTVNEQIAQARQAGQQYAQSFAGAMAQYNNMMSGRAGGNLVMNLENVKRVLNDLKTAAGKLNIISPYDEAKAKQLKEAIESLNKIVKQYKQVTDSSTTKPVISPQDAINMAKSATTLRQLETAYRALKEAMDTTDPKSDKWREMNYQLQKTKTTIDEIKKKMGEFQSQSQQTSNIMGQLQGRIAAAFSVGAITGFIKKMVDVRAQFELQRVALGAIIQDRDEANKIFTQVQNMALESPFNIMQLEKATKQIAAFGFETKKLVPTMKMFADISAGLGVEIDRLVLVMGHLKARNFLEGCLGLGTPVKMSDGSVKRVEDIAQGESIMGDDDTPRIVKQIIRGNEQMYKVSYADGSFRCNEKHILTLYNADKDVIEDVYVLDYLKTPDTYKGVRRIDGCFEYFDIVVEKDVMDNYYGFVIDGNRRFQLGDGTVTHNTMVRQFTNMGFNVLGELSKYYTELEDRMVSVGEVQDRVKKKMVSFEDVEEVLKRVTSAGGMFYDMQKKQSESLWGQMQRIQDAYDLMLNEIGQSNEGILKSALDTIRSLINHWRDLKPVIVSAVAAMGTFGASMFLIRGLPAILTSVVNGYRTLRICILAADKAQTMLNASTRANAWGALLSIVVAVGVAIYEVATAQSRLNEELGRIEEEGLGNMYNLIFQYRQLADAVQDYNKTYEERKDAMDEMKRVYGEILPDQMLEIDNIKKMKDGYNEATEAIKAHYEEKIKRQKEEAIKGDYEKKIKEKVEDAAERFTDSTYDAITKGMGLENIPEDTYRRNIENILTAITKEVEDGITPAEEASKRFKEVLMQNLAMSDADYKKISQSIDLNKAFEDAFSHQEYHGNRFGMGYFIENSILSTLQDMNDKIKEESESILGNLNAFMAPDAEPYVKQYELLTQAVGKYKQVIESLYNLQSEGKLFDKDGKLTKDAESLYNELNGWIEKINESGKIFGLNFQPTSEDVNNAIQSNIDKMEYFERVNVLTFGHVTESFDTWGAKLKNNTFLSGLVENWRRAWQQLNLSDEQREIRNLIKTVGELNNVDLSKYKWALIDSKDNVASVAKEVKSEVESLKTSIQKYQTAVAAGLPAMIASAFFLGGKTLEEVQQTLKAVDELYHKLGNADEATKKSGGKGKDPWQERVSLFKELNTEYEKLLKNYSEEEAKQRIQLSYAKAVAEIFKGQGKFGDINNWLGFDKESMIKIGQQMLDTLKISPEKRKELEKQLAALKATVDVEIQQDAVKEMEKQMQEVADSFELSEIFRKLGVPIDIVYTLGGKPTTLEDQRKALEDNYYEVFKVQKKYGEEGEKAYDKIQQDIAKKEQKNLEERAKNYIKYLTESVGERAQIEIKAMRDINNIQEDATLDAFSKEQAIMQRRKKMYDDLTKFDFDKLKSSDVYLTVMKDLENASKEQLQYVIDKIKELQSTFEDLSPAQVKSLANDLKNLEDAMAGKNATKNMFSNLKDAIKYTRQRNDLLKKQTDLQKSVDAESKMLTAAELYLTELELRRKSIQDESSEEWKEANKDVLKQQDIIKQLQDNIEKLKKKLAEVTGEINDGEVAWKGWKKGIGEVSQYFDAVVSAYNDIVDGLDSMGLISDDAKNILSAVGGVLDGLSQTIGGLESIDLLRPMTIITGLGKAIGGIFKTIGGFFGIGDAVKENKIKRLAEAVESLDKAYQKLEKSMEKAYTFSQYNAEFAKAQENLDNQKRSYQELKALEEDKKKSDKAKIKEYDDKLDEIAEKEEELSKKRHEMYGSTDDAWSEANNWLDAWFDAFKETGDGIDALNDSWDEFYENLIKKQAASKVLGARMDNWVKQINDAIDKNMGSEYEYIDLFKEIGEKMKSEFQATNEELKKIFEYAGLGASGSHLLSDLQQGIQNITEPQAAAIEAYLNSMRFAVFDQNTKLDTLIATIEMQYNTNSENPVVSELRGIRSLLSEIHSSFKSVIQTGNFNGARIRVC